MNKKTVFKSLMKFWKIKVLSDELQPEHIEELRNKSECVRNLKDFMNVFSGKVDPNTMDYQQCIAENTAAEDALIDERNKSMFED